ncbi:MAG: DUF4256 domain-containing protein [Sphaerochaeta sp.]
MIPFILETNGHPLSQCYGDCCYDRVFLYHNGADSYYASRGFRGLLKV